MLKSEGANEDDNRPPWHWVGFGTLLVFGAWLPLAYVASAIETHLVELRAASVRFEYRMERVGDVPEHLAEGFTRLACVNDRHLVQRFSGETLATFGSAEIAPAGDTLG